MHEPAPEPSLPVYGASAPSPIPALAPGAGRPAGARVDVVEERLTNEATWRYCAARFYCPCGTQIAVDGSERPAPHLTRIHIDGVTCPTCGRVLTTKPAPEASADATGAP